MRSIVLLAGMNVNETPFRFTKEQRDEKQHAFMMLLPGYVVLFWDLHVSLIVWS